MENYIFYGSLRFLEQYIAPVAIEPLHAYNLIIDLEEELRNRAWQLLLSWQQQLLLQQQLRISAWRQLLIMTQLNVAIQSRDFFQGQADLLTENLHLRIHQLLAAYRTVENYEISERELQARLQAANQIVLESVEYRRRASATVDHNRNLTLNLINTSVTHFQNFLKNVQ